MAPKTEPLIKFRPGDRVVYIGKGSLYNIEATVITPDEYEQKSGHSIGDGWEDPVPAIFHDDGYVSWAPRSSFANILISRPYRCHCGEEAGLDDYLCLECAESYAI